MSSRLPPGADLAGTLHAATAHHQAGRLAEAEALYRRVVAIAPANADALHLLGVLLHQRGDRGQALALLRKAVGLAPRKAAFHGNLGTVLLAGGDLQEAAAAFERAIALQPQLAEAHQNLGLVRLRQGRIADAEASLRRALALRPSYVEAHHNLALALQARGALEESVTAYERALALRPAHADTHNDLGTALQALARREEALAHYRMALQLQPRHPMALNNLGTVLHDMGDVDGATAAFEAAIALDPALANAHFNLANVLLERCNLEAALRAFDRAQAIEPRGRNRFAHATALCPLWRTREDIDAARARIARELEALVDDAAALEDPLREGLAPMPLLAYHGRDDRSLQALCASAFLAACPSLAFVAPHCRTPGARAHERIRLGFLSRYFYNHTIGEVMRGIVQQIDRSRFEVTILRLGRESDPIADSIAGAADHVVDLPHTLHDAREVVAACELDVLVYPEVGMDPGTYFLAFSRLAPLQCVMWGHPDTTGIPALDYYVSADEVEPPDAQAMYTEKLVRLPRIATYYLRPQAPAEWPDRTALGLPAQGNLYVCPQTLYKLHPDMDALLRGILEADPAGWLVLFESRYAGWRDLLRERFSRTMPGVAGRVVFLPRMALTRYFALLHHAGAVLDTRPFGGGNTAFQAFAFGVPVVTWPHEHARGRVTAALYRRMGVSGLVASHADEYVALAVRLANDPSFHAQMRAAILQSADVLYEDVGMVREFERFLDTAVRAAGGDAA